MIEPSQEGGLLGKFYPVDVITRMVSRVPLNGQTTDISTWIDEQGGRLQYVRGYRSVGNRFLQNGYIVYLPMSGHLLFKLAWHNV